MIFSKQQTSTYIESRQLFLAQHVKGHCRERPEHVHIASKMYERDVTEGREHHRKHRRI